MAALLFKLRNVPEDEAEEIRALLLENSIEFYETTAGSWGISMPGIWTENNDDIGRAKALINEYQNERAVNSRKDYEAAVREGRAPSFLDSVKKRPLAIIGITLFCLFVLYAMTGPFIKLALKS